MKYTVVFYTRTGISKRIAEKIAKALDEQPVQITDRINWNGFIGYIKAGFYSMANRHVEIEMQGEVGQPDAYIVVTPLWAGGIAPATKTFLKTVPAEQVHLVVSSLGSHVKEREGYLSVNDITDEEQNEDEVIDSLECRLKEK